MDLAIRPRTLFLVLMYIALGLTLINTALLLAGWITGRTYMMGFMALFNVGKESNIPTWYSSFILLLAAAFLYAIASAKKSGGEQYATHWRALSIIFLFMSIDEAASVHERLGALIGRMLPMPVLTNYGWLVPGIILATIVIVVFMPFLMSLPSPTRRLSILAGALFLGGASGIEGLSLKWGLAQGFGTIHYRLLTTVEEFMEMAGVVVFIYALALYIAEHMNRDSIAIRLTSQEH